MEVIHMRRWDRGLGGGGFQGDVLRSIALMTATIWSLVTVWLYPHLIGVARIGKLYFSMGGRLIKRGVARVFWSVWNSYFWEAKFYWVVTLLHGKQDKSVIDTIFTFTDCLKRVWALAVNRWPFKTQSPQLSTQHLHSLQAPGIRNRNAGL